MILYFSLIVFLELETRYCDICGLRDLAKFYFKSKSLNIPLILLNARITKKVLIDGKFWKDSDKIFKSFSSCISSSKDTSRYLDILGAQNIKFFGNIKFCSSINADNKYLDQFNNVKKERFGVH